MTDDELWPLPTELAHMSGQFRLGYLQARNEGLAKIEKRQVIIETLSVEIMRLKGLKQ
jgi:hypothetical protein